MIYVTESSYNFTILEKYTAFDMGILSIDCNRLETKERDTAPVEHRAKQITKDAEGVRLVQQFYDKASIQEQKIQVILQHYDKVFQGIGKHKYRQVKLHIEETEPPKVWAQRLIPFAHRDKLENLLNELEHKDVTQRVEGPTDWVSNIVITPKADANKIRINIDMTTANKAIKRTRHIIPTVEELRYRMNRARYFTRLDMKIMGTISSSWVNHHVT